MTVRRKLGEEARLGAPGEGGCNHESVRRLDLSGEHARHTKLRLTRRVRSTRGGGVLATDLVSSQPRIRDCSRSVHK
jgi:hypothetical protein